MKLRSGTNVPTYEELCVLKKQTCQRYVKDIQGIVMKSSKAYMQYMRTLDETNKEFTDNVYQYLNLTMSLYYVLVCQMKSYKGKYIVKQNKKYKKIFEHTMNVIKERTIDAVINYQEATATTMPINEEEPMNYKNEAVRKLKQVYELVVVNN